MINQQAIQNLLDLTGQVALITGANRGIGKATAEVLHAAGANVALLARTADALTEVADSLLAVRADSALALPVDVADEMQVNQAVEQTVVRWGQIDTRPEFLTPQ